jgi:methylglyoxal synthase
MKDMERQRKGEEEARGRAADAVPDGPAAKKARVEDVPAGPANGAAALQRVVAPLVGNVPVEHLLYFVALVNRRPGESEVEAMVRLAMGQHEQNGQNH